MDNTYRIKFIHKIENVLVKDVYNTISPLIRKHKQKFNSFLIVCKTEKMTIFHYTEFELLRWYTDENEMINIGFRFYSNIEDIRFNYYLFQPKPMLETLLMKNLDKYPKKLKLIKYSKLPYYNYLKIKYYGYSKGGDIRIRYDDWFNNTPKEPDDVFKEILKNR